MKAAILTVATMLGLTVLAIALTFGAAVYVIGGRK